MSNAVQTKDNEANHLIIYCLNCIPHNRNAAYEPGLRDPTDCPFEVKTWVSINTNHFHQRMSSLFVSLLEPWSKLKSFQSYVLIVWGFFEICCRIPCIWESVLRDLRFGIRRFLWWVINCACFIRATQIFNHITASFDNLVYTHLRQNWVKSVLITKKISDSCQQLTTPSATYLSVGGQTLVYRDKSSKKPWSCYKPGPYRNNKQKMFFLG